MNEIDRLIGVAQGINIPADPSTTAGKIALLLKGENAAIALDSLCYVIAMLIRTVPVDARDYAFVHVQHLVRRMVLADLDEDDE